jgi:acetyltransferase-like isoleucine patch superfamily enzyme
MSGVAEGGGGRLARFFRATNSTRLNLVRAAWRRVITRAWYAPMFRSVGAGTVIFEPLMLSNTEFMTLGDRVTIRPGARLEVVLHGQPWQPSLQIGNRVNLEQNVHIVCHDRVILEDDVSVTGHCAIVDTTHPHSAALQGRKIGEAIDDARSCVRIGRNSFLGFGAIVLPNVTIGRNCMIGAGSVVAADVPDNSVAAGVPARVLGTLDFGEVRHG